MVDGASHAERIRPRIAGRRWLVAYDVAAAATRCVATLRELGALRPFVLAGARGMGPLPDGAEIAILGTRGRTMMEQIRATERALADPGPEVQARIEAWDPDRRAQVIGTIFSRGRPVCGRPAWGGRPERWQALEDKLLAESIWDGAGIARAPALVVPARAAALREAAARLDAGQGTVWAGDMREGFHGGAEYVRRVGPGDPGREAAAFFSARCDRVRVMPFLEGLPCSIHGMVFDREVIAFRPCEMLVLRQPGTDRFRYASAATFWEPPAERTRQMREVARRVGAHLRARVGYRGAFTVDGVLTAEGFRPTELNPRVGAALIRLTAPIEGLPMELLNLALVAGEPVDWRPRELEELVCTASRRHRSGSGALVLSAPFDEEREAALRYEAGSCRPAGEGAADLRLSLGEHPAGSLLRVVLDPERTPVGPPAAPRVAAALAWADARWKLGIGPIQPAPEA